MRVLYKPVGAPVEVREVENTLEALQSLVGGYIEVVRVGDVFGGALYYVVNEEGKLLGLKPNVHTWHDVLCGPVVMLACDGDEFRSLDDSEVEFGEDVMTTLSA